MDGFDLVVLGTPHLPQWTYELWACLLGQSVKAFDSRCLNYQPVTRNGYQFNFVTFSDPGLQEIQLHLIESELIQAAGRARTLRNDCAVFIFAGLPIP